MKTIAWNATNEEFDLFYDIPTNFEKLLNYYIHSCSPITNQIKTNKNPAVAKRVLRCQMKALYRDNKTSNPRFKKFIQWIGEDKQSRLRRRELQNHKDTGKIVDMKDKENDRLYSELQEAKLRIIDLERKLNRKNIIIEELEEKLSS